MTIQDALSAGGPQRATADARRERAEQYARLQQNELDLALRHEAGAHGEVSVAATLQALAVYGWRLLVDRRWPLSAANVDLVMVGPGGVLVVDATSWAEPRVEGGRLYRGDSDETDGLMALGSSTHGVITDVLAEVGYAPAGVLVVAVLAGRRLPATEVAGAVVVGERDVAAWLAQRPRRLDGPAVEEVVTLLDRAFPPHRPSGRHAMTTPRASTTRLAPPRPRRAAVEETAELFDVTRLTGPDLLEIARAEALGAAAPTERWMTWLHPEQAPLVRRTFNGPARLAGPAGTGKTVVALHRAALAAQQPGARVLVTSFVRTLTDVLGELVTRLVPEHAHRIEATGLHRWALDLLGRRGTRCRLDPGACDTAFWLTWSRVGRHGPLGAVSVEPRYWREEVDHVVKGRGITDFEVYAALERVGRRTPLRLEQRAAVWDLYVAYDQQLRERGVHDFTDVLALARDELLAHPLEPPYTSVVVDEVQDLTMVGVQLLHALVGDRADGLLLVGDSAQALYPGGFRLAEAGIAVVGRSIRLGTNYRNGAAILAHAHTVGARPVDLDVDPDAHHAHRAPATVSGASVAGMPVARRLDDLTPGEAGRPPTTPPRPRAPLEERVAEPPLPVQVRRTVVVSRGGGEVVEVEAATERELEDALVAALAARIAAGTRPGDCAVLTRSNAQATRLVTLLGAAGVPGLPLTAYRGRPCDTVKVGTVHRAKGLEFGHVALRDCDPSPPRRPGEDDSGHAERAEVWCRELHVAMTRARDSLWCGRVVGPRTGR